MSEESLRNLLTRIEEDTTFREHIKNDPKEALREYELSVAERAALVTNDGDALRRLAGAETVGFTAGLGLEGPGGALFDTHNCAEMFTPSTDDLGFGCG